MPILSDNFYSNLHQELNFEVIEEPLYAGNRRVEGWKLLKNSDTNAPIYCHRDGYGTITNERIEKLVDGIVGASNFKLIGYHIFGQGERIISFLENQEPVSYAGLKSKDYMVIGDSRDKNTSFFTGFSNTLIRCTNQFTALAPQKVRHNRYANNSLLSVEETIDLFYNKSTGVYEKWEQMANVSINTEDKFALTQKLINPKGEQKLSNYKVNQLGELHAAIDRECGDLGDNLLALFNGVTYFTTHKLSQRDTVFGNPVNRANQLNQDAFKFCSKKLKESTKPLMIAI